MNASSNESSVTYLMNKLCTHLCGSSKENSKHLLKIGLHLLTTVSVSNSITPYDEMAVVEKIKQRIIKTKSNDDALRFTVLHAKLQKKKLIKNRIQILLFLLQTTADYSSESEVQALADMRDSLIQTYGFALQSSQSGSSVSVEPAVEVLYPPLEIKTSCSNSTTTQESSQVQSTVWGQDTGMAITRRPKTTSTDSSEINTFNMSFIPEHELIQEIIFAFQGIEGKILRHEPGGGLRIDAKTVINRSQKRLIQRLIEMGYLHNHVRQYCETADKELGIIAQSFVTALRDELTEYYKLIAVLQEQHNVQAEMTLRRLLIWVAEPQARLQWLVTIASSAQDKKGGALISSIYSFLQHGSPPVRTLVKHLLVAVCRPLLTTLSRWVLEGQLDDPYAEFFIEARPDISNDRLWHEKYRVRKNMVPSFITSEQADKILATGKSIDFLREVCNESALFGSHKLKRMFDENNVEALFTAAQSSALHAAIECAYKETSKKVLDILMNKYNLVHHLHALRRYMLLGQGDFIRHLMELLMPELSQPAMKLYPHNLSAILETAIRATNARYEDQDTLDRLDVKVLQVSTRDTGWEVFTLIYHVNGPIGTVFEPHEDIYLSLFASLWNAKRMEFILSTLWKNQAASTKTFRKLPDLSTVMQQMHLLTSEMIHLVHQMQYYMLFEVLECHWAELGRCVANATSLDDVIQAHGQFLMAVRAGALLDPASEDLGRQLRTVYGHIIQLQTFEDRLCSQANAELKAEQEREEKIGDDIDDETTERDEALRKERQLRFQQVLSTAKGHLRTLALSYQKNVRKFLAMLAAQHDVNLQLLSSRLDFNGHYKRNSKKPSSTKSTKNK